MNRFVPTLGDLRLAGLASRVRQSLFAIPGLCLIVGIGLAELMIRLDRNDAGAWLPDTYETTEENARAVLGAIATGTITVVTLVLTLTLVAIQLAAGQLSPRTIVNFLGDRFQQATVGVVLGTATFSLLGLRALRVTAEGDGLNPPDLTVLTGVVLTVLSLVMLVASVDRTANRLAVGNLLHDITEETCALIEVRYGTGPSPLEGELASPVLATPGRPDWTVRAEVSSDRAGWLQSIDEDGLLDVLPDGSRARLLHPVGTFVFSSMILVEVDDDLTDEALEGLRRAIVVGDGRTMKQDVSFGLTRLTDVGLRALSPGINDANTAREVAMRLGQVVLTLQAHELPSSEIERDGVSLERVGAPSHDDYVRGAFDQIRNAASSQGAVLETLHRTMTAVISETERRGLPGSTDELRRQAQLVERSIEQLPDRARPQWPPESSADRSVMR